MQRHQLVISLNAAIFADAEEDDPVDLAPFLLVLVVGRVRDPAYSKGLLCRLVNLPPLVLSLTMAVTHLFMKLGKTSFIHYRNSDTYILDKSQPTNFDGPLCRPDHVRRSCAILPTSIPHISQYARFSDVNV